jgi:hypothetical protein
VYESCDSDETDAQCDAHLDGIGQRGFGLVINYGLFESEPQRLVAYADAAARANVAVAWDLSSSVFRDGSLAAPEIDDRITAVREHAATWGWYVGDEAPGATPECRAPGETSAVDAVMSLSSRVHALDPGHPRLFVHYTSDADAPARCLEPFLDATDYAGLDIYPKSQRFPVERLADDSRTAASLVRARARRWVVVLQAYDGGSSEYAARGEAPGFPSLDELRRERALAFTGATPDLVLWYSAYDVRHAPDPAARWTDLATAAFGR